MFNKQDSIHDYVNNLVNECNDAPITQKKALLNVLFTIEKAISALGNIKGSIKGSTRQLEINELLIIGAELETVIEYLAELKHKHQL